MRAREAGYPPPPLPPTGDEGQQKYVKRPQPATADEEHHESGFPSVEQAALSVVLQQMLADAPTPDWHVRPHAAGPQSVSDPHPAPSLVGQGVQTFC